MIFEELERADKIWYNSFNLWKTILYKFDV